MSVLIFDFFLNLSAPLGGIFIHFIIILHTFTLNRWSLAGTALDDLAPMISIHPSTHLRSPPLHRAGCAAETSPLEGAVSMCSWAAGPTERICPCPGSNPGPHGREASGLPLSHGQDIILFLRNAMQCAYLPLPGTPTPVDFTATKPVADPCPLSLFRVM